MVTFIVIFELQLKGKIIFQIMNNTLWEKSRGQVPTEGKTICYQHKSIKAYWDITN